jgi:predicted GIY-YIG superfamily endonuclease
MVYVYALSNKINLEIYIGISADSERRLKEHNQGKSRYTRAYRPWQKFYSEGCDSYASARKRELYFKTTSGRREIRKKLEEYNLLIKE